MTYLINKLEYQFLNISLSPTLPYEFLVGRNCRILTCIPDTLPSTVLLSQRNDLGQKLKSFHEMLSLFATCRENKMKLEYIKEGGKNLSYLM